jgi:uncharacterized protein YjdB
MQHLAAVAGLVAIAATASAQKPVSIDVPSRVSVVAGSDTSVVAVVKDMAGKPIPGASVRYESSDTSIVQVTMLGSLKGVSPGTARVTATAVDANGSASPGVTATISVTVRTDESPAVRRPRAPTLHPKRGP